MKILSKEKEKCYGCAACYSICPHKAITLIKNDEGFLYPYINEEYCIKCSICEKICPINKQDEGNKILEVYAAVNKNLIHLKNSSSGGVFIALATQILNQGGVVFGCAWNEKIEAEHICVEDSNYLQVLQGSKYVQSDIKNTYIEARNYLRQNKKVLYVGTPCQIAGLKSFLGQKYDNLITIDLICHGAPSPKIFEAYIRWLEEKFRGKIIGVSFRDKSKNGWGLVGKIKIKMRGKIKEKIIAPKLHWYYEYFVKGYIYRKSCYECKYASPNRVGDITIGDYWGIQEVHPDIEWEDGVSVILVNTEIGLEAIDLIEEQVRLVKSNFTKVSQQNHQLLKPAEKSSNREEIYIKFLDKGYKQIATDYNKKMKKERLKFRIKMLVPREVRKLLKKVINVK